MKHIKEWVEVAARLGAPEAWESVSKGSARSQVQDWIASALREYADHGSS